MKIHARRIIAGIVAASALFVGTLSASAGWREDLGTFRIGMLAEPGSSRMIEGLSEIRRAYSVALGVPVEIFVARDFAALIDAQATSRVEYAIYSTLAFATASRLCSCVEPLVARQGANSEIGIRSVLIIKKSKLSEDGGINSAKIAINQGVSVTTAVIPALALSGSQGPVGISSEQLTIAASESDAENMLITGKVDGLFGWASSNRSDAVQGSLGTMARLSQAGVDADDYEIYWRSQLLPFGPHAVRSDVDDEAKDLLREFLRGLAKNKPEVHELLVGPEALALRQVSADDYQLAYEIVDRLSGK